MPTVAVELEFYLVESGDDGAIRPRFPDVPGTRLRQRGAQYGMLEDLWHADAFLEDVRTAAASQGLPVTTALSEVAAAQFEVNLHHERDAVRACDSAILLKRLIKGVAARHGLSACFMAKPFAASAGCGMHVHLSLYDSGGTNAFAKPRSRANPPVSRTMRFAVAGMLAAMRESMAVFAPHANSFRRLVPGAYAPLSSNWGHNHRNVAIRIPVSDANNLRLEHRVSGADANPYLVVAALLGGAHHGITHELEPPAMIRSGTLLDEGPAGLPRHWPEAIDAFEAGTILPAYFGEENHRLYASVRRDECEEYAATVPALDFEWYLRAV
jgi:glutamine synthetase